MGQIKDFFGRRKKEELSDVELIVLYATHHLTEEERKSFEVEENNRRYSFYDILLSEYSDSHLNCSLIEARCQVHDFIEWFRRLSRRGSYERKLFILRFSRFLTSEPKPSRSPLFCFSMGIAYATLLHVIIVLAMAAKYRL